MLYHGKKRFYVHFASRESRHCRRTRSDKFGCDGRKKGSWWRFSRLSPILEAIVESGVAMVDGRLW